MIPEVDFPPENAADFAAEEKFAKPIWFVPPQDTKFAKAIPQSYPKVTADICRASLRKAVCGQMRVAGFTDTAESALILFADACEEFIRNLMLHIRDVHANNPELEKQRDIEVKTLEKAYYSMTNTSLTQVHNYFKHHLIARNRMEIAEFNGAFYEYDKLMKESQKEEFHEGDFINIFASTSDGSNAQGMASMQEFTTVPVGVGIQLANNGATGIILDNSSNQITMQQDAQSAADLQSYAADIATHFQAHE